MARETSVCLHFLSCAHDRTISSGKFAHWLISPAQLGDW